MDVHMELGGLYVCTLNCHDCVNDKRRKRNMVTAERSEAQAI